MFKKIILFLIVGVLALGAILTTTSHALNERISYLMDKKIVVGDENGNLKLDQSISRASLAKIVVYTIGAQERAEKLKNAPSIFNDMAAGSWANGFANVAATEGIIIGYPNGNFGPNDPVTYEQAIKMLVVATIGRDLNEAEKAGKPWATPYIEKASELGLLKHSNISNYKLVAPRKDIFDILYEAIKYRENKDAVGIRALVLGKENDKLKVKIIRTEKETPYKKDDIALVNFENPIEAINAIGKVIDFTVANNKATDIRIAKEYEVKFGPAKIGRDGLLYFEGDKLGYEIDRNDYKKDYLEGIIHNGENYSYGPLINETKGNFDYAVVTLHNSKVVFLRTFNFTDIAPVADNKLGDIYILRDSRPNETARSKILTAWEIGKDGLKTVDPSRIEIDSVLHFYNNNSAIVTNNTISNVRFKVHKTNQGTYIEAGTHVYRIVDENNQRPIINIDFKNYTTLYPDRNLNILKAMEGKSSVILLDLFNRVQLVRGDLNQQEEMMIVQKTTGNAVRLMDMSGDIHEVRDTFDLEIMDGKRVTRMSDLEPGDLVYVFRDADEFKKIAVIMSNYDMKARALKVDKDDKSGQYKIDLLPTRGRYALVDIEGKTYELTDSTTVFVEDGWTIRPTSLKQIRDHANLKKELKAYPITVRDFLDRIKSSNIPNDRDDLLKAIVFYGYEEELKSDSVITGRAVYGFDPYIDKSIVLDYADGRQIELSIFKNARLEKFSAGDIVRVNISKDKKVLDVNVLLNQENRTYEVLGIMERDGVRKLELKRADTGDLITKYLARDIEIFGDLKIGSLIQMHVDRDDIKVLNVLR